MMDLPKIRDDIDIRDLHVDGTPDGKYALRLLEAYRKRCNCKWVVDGKFAEGGGKLLYDAMNEHQDLRAKELDKAIEILRKYL